MGKIWKFLIELGGAALLVGWLLYKYPLVVGDWIPWLCLAVFWHLVWEISHDGITGAWISARRNVAMVYVVAFIVGGLASTCLIWGVRKGASKMEIAEKQREHPTAVLMDVQITWHSPDPILYGTSLSTTQLNASTKISGKLSYDPDVGTILPVGSHQLTARFTPDDRSKYSEASANVSIVVNPAPPSKPSSPPNARSETLTPSLDVTYDVANKLFYFVNRGSSNIYLWSTQYGPNSNMEEDVKEPTTITPNGGAYHIYADTFDSRVRSLVVNGSIDVRIFYWVYITMDDKRERVLKYEVWAHGSNDILKVDTQNVGFETRSFKLR